MKKSDLMLIATGLENPKTFENTINEARKSMLSAGYPSDVVESAILHLRANKAKVVASLRSDKPAAKKQKTKGKKLGGLRLAGLTQTSPITKLPDGSAFMTASMPLPKTHWLYGRELRSAGEPWLICGTSQEKLTIELNNQPRRLLESIISKAARHAIRAATANGTQMDFDPDALVQNLIVELLGFNTPDGLSRVDKPAKAKRKAKKS